MILAAGACTLLAFAARRALAARTDVAFSGPILLDVGSGRPCYWRAPSARGRLVIAAALATVNLVLIVPLYFGPAITSPIGPVSRGMSLNVYFHNRDYERTLEMIRREDPDFVLLLEVTPDWAEAMRALEATYPHGHLEPRKDSGGMALFSRVPIEDLEVRRLGEHGPSTIAGATGFAQRHVDPDRRAHILAQDTPRTSLRAIGNWWNWDDWPAREPARSCSWAT